MSGAEETPCAAVFQCTFWPLGSRHQQGEGGGDTSKSPCPPVSPIPPRFSCRDREICDLCPPVVLGCAGMRDIP